MGSPSPTIAAFPHLFIFPSAHLSVFPSYPIPPGHHRNHYQSSKPLLPPNPPHNLPPPVDKQRKKQQARGQGTKNKHTPSQKPILREDGNSVDQQARDIDEVSEDQHLDGFGFVRRTSPAGRSGSLRLIGFRVCARAVGRSVGWSLYVISISKAASGRAVLLGQAGVAMKEPGVGLDLDLGPSMAGMEVLLRPLTLSCSSWFACAVQWLKLRVHLCRARSAVTDG